MNKTIRAGVLLALSAILISTNSLAGESHDKGDVCHGYGPQTPRDIDNLHGENKNIFSLAPDSDEMNLCNIHFHNNAEHKAKEFAIYTGEGDHGYGGGYQCSISKTLSKTELKPTKGEICKGLKPGDTIEVHWVHTSCDLKPGPGLGSCLSEKCANPELRVEAQVFTLVNDANALDFNTLVFDGNVEDGFNQAKNIPDNTGKPVEFMGSSTGPKYNDQQCSPLLVTWGVRPQCAKLDIHTIGKWCESNVFGEDHAHGVRKLVTNPKLLSEID